jgi:plastocyanin
MFSSLRRRMRPLLTASVAAGLLAMGTVGMVSAASMKASDHTARTWYVQTGAQSPNGVIQGMVFLPGTITVDVGDTIVWQAHSAEPHTVTFNAAPNAQFNPFAPAVGNGAAFDGTGYVSSGAMANVSSETAGFPVEREFSLTFTKAGTFHYVCLVHPGMGGAVVVQPAGTPYPESQPQYEQQGRHQTSRIIAAGYQLKAQDQQASNNHYVIAGDTNMEAGADVMAYMRSTVVIHVGESVSFVNKSMEPHTITFGDEIGNPTNPWCANDCSASTLPSQGPIFGGNYSATLSGTDAVFNSGWVFTGVQVTVTFTHPGVYEYHCALHDYMGMVGKVIVEP